MNKLFSVTPIPGDILFVFEKDSFLSKLIWFLTRRNSRDKKISHTCVYLGNDLIVDILSPGVVFRGIDVYKKSKYGVLIGRPKEKVDIDKLYKIALRDSCNIQYDFKQLIAFLIFTVTDKIKIFFSFDDDTTQVCSEWTNNTFKELGIELVSGKESKFVSPMDIYYSNEIEKI